MGLPVSRRQMLAQVFASQLVPAFAAASPGATLAFYKAGTQTPAPVYADAELTLKLANPHVWSDAARSRPVYLDGSQAYRVVLRDASGKIVHDVDPLAPIILQGAASVTDFGAKGDGTTDDTAAIAAALAASLDVMFPVGRYRISAPIAVRSNQRLRGAGKSPGQPYTGERGANPAGFLTEILVAGFAAFDMSGTNTAAVSGFAVRARGGGQSRFGTGANYVAGSMGFLLTGSSNADISNVSFHSLHYGVAAGLGDGQAEAAFWKLRDFMATDCDTVVRTGTATAKVVTSRDFMVADCAIADHCNHMVEAHWADGMTLTSLRFFHSFGKSVAIRASTFVTMAAVTLFETRADSLTLDGCSYVTMSAMCVSRAGGYTGTTPWPAFTGVTIRNCNSVSFDGIIERSSWIALSIAGSSAIKINGVVDTPFFTAGNLAPMPGAIDITASRAVILNCAMAGAGNWVCVHADHASAASLSGAVTADPFCGVVRAYGVISGDRVHDGRTRADIAIGALGSALIDTIRVLVPAGKTLVTRSVYLTSPGVVLRSGSLFWNAGVTSDAGGETLSLENKTIMKNTAGKPAYFTLGLSLYNPTGATVVVPAGHRTQISFAFV